MQKIYQSVSPIEKLLGANFDEILHYTKLTANNNETIGNYKDIFKECMEISNRSHDDTAPYSAISVVDDPNRIFALRVADRTYTFSKRGLEALCVACGISFTYIKRCVMADKGWLAAENLNEWIAEKSNASTNRAFIRVTDDQVHGFLTTKYSAFDSHLVLSELMPILSPLNEYDVVGKILTPDIMKLRLVSRNSFDLNGDKLSYGFDIANSGVGLSSLKVTFLIYRFICGNGMLMGGDKGTYYMQRHIGINQATFGEEFKSFMRDIPALTADIKDQISKSMQKTIGKGDVQNFIDQFKVKKISSAVDERLESECAAALAGNNIQTVWDFTNIITQMAQDFSYLTREKMEKAAGEILVRGVR